MCSESSFTPVVFMDLSLLLAKRNLTMLAQVNTCTVCLTAHSSASTSQKQRNNRCFLFYHSDLFLCVDERFPTDATVELLFSSGPQRRGKHLST